MFRSLRMSVAFVLLLSPIYLVNAQAVIEPSDRPVRLKGVIREIHGYGPPGYGEDKKADMPVTYMVIEVLKPINIPCIPERPEWKSIDCQASKRLRLFFSSDCKDELEIKAKKMMGRKVVVTGTLERQTTAGEFTPVIVKVTAIEPHAAI